LRGALLQGRLEVRAAAESRFSQAYRVIADVHANIDAQAVLRKRSLGVDNMFVSVRSAGPNPRECVQRLAALPNASYVRGNHDHAIGTGVFSDGMNALARSCADWT
jgi:hypothetical protein